jgi:hypothetical protein
MDFIQEKSAFEVDEILVDKETMAILASLSMADLPGTGRQEVSTTLTLNRPEFLCFTSDVPGKCSMKCRSGIIVISDPVASSVVPLPRAACTIVSAQHQAQ